MTRPSARCALALVCLLFVAAACDGAVGPRPADGGGAAPDAPADAAAAREDVAADACHDLRCPGRGDGAPTAVIGECAVSSWSLEEARTRLPDCRFDLGDSSTDPARVNIAVSSDGGAADWFMYSVPTAADCPTGTDAWYFDPPPSMDDSIPTPFGPVYHLSVRLCPRTCDALAATPPGPDLYILFALGCGTVLL